MNFRLQKFREFANKAQLQWIYAIQCVAGCFFLFFMGAAAFLFLSLKDVTLPHSETEVHRKLPKSAFEFARENYINFIPDAFHLNYMAPCLHFPDLKGALVYYGQNGRPDVALETPKLFFGMQGGKSVISASYGQKIYLRFDKTATGSCKYIFSPNNEPTLVWFTATPEGKEAKLVLEMEPADGILIASDDANRYFSLPEKEFIRAASHGTWEIGSWRVDGSLLVRQKARWIGPDRFLERHGGEDFPDFIDKHRIDFGEGEEAYFTYVKRGDCLIWDANRWKPYDGKENSQDKPLLVVKKIDEKVMSLEVWDVEGKGKVTLSLVKSPDTFRHDQIMRDFRFVGARTKSQVVFQIEDERLVVKPNDWLLHTKEGWKKLSTPSEIDEYVDRKLVGTLFIFQEIARRDEKPILVGSIYNPNRTELHEIEVALLPAGSHTAPNLPGTVPEQKNLEKPNQNATPIATH